MLRLLRLLFSASCRDKTYYLRCRNKHGDTRGARLWWYKLQSVAWQPYGAFYACAYVALKFYSWDVPSLFNLKCEIQTKDENLSNNIQISPFKFHIYLVIVFFQFF